MANNGVCHLKIGWFDNFGGTDFPGALIGKVVQDAPEKWTLLLKVRVFDPSKNKQVVLFFNTPVDPFNSQWSGDREQPTAWGMQKLGPGVWSLEPSLVIPGVFHAFITLIDVPSPAPWEPKPQEKKADVIPTEKS